MGVLYGNGRATEDGLEVAHLLKEAANSGLEVGTHLGHTRSVSSRYKGSDGFIPCKISDHLLYLRHYVHTVDAGKSFRIGHGSVLRHDVLEHPKTAAIADELLRLLKSKSAVLERSPSRQLRTLGDVQSNVPVWFWRDHGLDWRLGVDELNHGTSLSQWILMLMLADLTRETELKATVQDWRERVAPCKVDIEA